MTDDGPSIKQLRTREVYRNAWLALREDEVEFPDGTTGLYSVVDKPDFVVVVAYEGGGFWLVQQFRYPVGHRTWEFPQGGWPAGSVGGSPAQLAAAELSEETGLRAGSLAPLGRLHAAHGFCSQRYDVFLATDLTPGPSHPEPTESDLVHAWYGAADVRAMIDDGSFADAHSVAALALFDLQQP